MTTITYKPYALEIQGHSGYAVAGRDIVCAGVSTLFFTLIEVLARNGLRPRVRMGDGAAEVTLPDVPETGTPPGAGATPLGEGGFADAVFETVVTGLRMMAEKYPDHVSFSRGDR